MKLKEIIIEAEDKGTQIGRWVSLKDRQPMGDERRFPLLTWDGSKIRVINISSSPRDKLPTDVTHFCYPESPE
jgi:hypothetical protein